MSQTSNEVAIWAVLSDVATERRGQDARWGVQNHDDVHDYATRVLSPGALARLYRRRADDWKTTNEHRAEHGIAAWDGILLEEVYEALTEAAEGNVDDLYTELVQVAAVATCWAEALKRRKETAS